MYYTIAHHGTAGLDSFGYAETVHAQEAPRTDMTTTVYGPYATKAAADAETVRVNAQLEAWRVEHE